MSGRASCSAAVHWFRKGLRLHDNPALLEAFQRSKEVVYPVFVIDPWFAKPDVIGVNRYAFLLDSLADIDSSLRKIGSRLFVLRGKPDEVLPKFCSDRKIDLVTFEVDTEPYAKRRDELLENKLKTMDVEVRTHHTHTLNDLEMYLGRCKGNIPYTYRAFQKVFDNSPPVREPVPAPTQSDVPSGTSCSKNCESFEDALSDASFDIPSLEEMGYGDDEPKKQSKYPGGETEALKRLDTFVEQRPKWTTSFEKPRTSPNSIDPSTTVLSPYLKFGCLSPALFWRSLKQIQDNAARASKTSCSKPPVSLQGQLLWREFFYFQSIVVPNFDRMEGNPRCRQIPWGRDPAIVGAWAAGKTGYPYIDAIMNQLRQEGWIHHLARHSVACFLTRGDLWQHWEEGQKVFDRYLLDADWALNAGNWQWLSCSNYFYQYFRCYSPVAFGKKTDKSGSYIRKYVPALRKMPEKFIYEPWKAPRKVQHEVGCVLGEDYPERIVVHEEVSKENMSRMKEAYANQPDSDAHNENHHQSLPSKRKAAVPSKTQRGKKATKGQKSVKQYFGPGSKKARE